MKLIQEGALDSISKISGRLSLSLQKLRSRDDLTTFKNNLIIFNTLCRKAAQYGGVHPVYLNQESNKFLQRIEKTSSRLELEYLYRSLPRRYCLIVCSSSMKQHSPIIQKILVYITFNLDADLSLRHLASVFSINKNYLSNLFKKETGKSLTVFVKERRIHNAIYLLNTTHFSIQNIAELCGIEDLNYFSRIFRQQIGISPSEYRKQIKQKPSEALQIKTGLPDQR